jgi:hypothetical protein
MFSITLVQWTLQRTERAERDTPDDNNEGEGEGSLKAGLTAV